MTENLSLNPERQYISSLRLAALNCHLVDNGDDTDDWRSRIVVYAGSALTLSRWETLSIAHLFKAIGFLRVGMYACAAREFEHAAAAVEKEGRENPRGTLPFWDEIQDGEY